MCSICRQTPCASLCPNNTQQEVILCPVCGEIVGEVAYCDRSGTVVGCESCIVVRDLYNR